MAVELSINPELKRLLPALSKDEREQLEENILADGRVFNAIIYWPNGGKNYIVDGMHRYEIATKHSIPFDVQAKQFASQDDAERWMLNHAIGHRNLTPEGIRTVRGELYKRVKQKVGHPPEDENSDIMSELAVTGNVSTVSEAVAVMQVDERTLRRDEKRVDNKAELIDSLRKKIDDGTFKISDADLELLAKQTHEKQNEVAREARTNNQSLAWAMEKLKIKKKRTAPKPECPVSKGKHEWESDGNGERYCIHCKEDHPDSKKPRAKQGKEISPAKMVDALTKKHVGYLVRGIDAVAKINGGKGPNHKQANDSLNTLIGALKKMRKGER